MLLLHIIERLLRYLVLLLAGGCRLLDHVLRRRGVLRLHSIEYAAPILEQGIILHTHRVDDVPLVGLAGQEVVHLVIRSDVIVARELLQLVPELVVVAVRPTDHPDVLALQVLQALLPHLVRVQVDDLVVPEEEILRRKLSARAVLAVLDDLRLRVELGLREVALGHVAQVALVQVVPVIDVHFVEAGSHLLGLVGEGLGPGSGLVHLLVVVEGVAGSQFLLPDQVPLRELHLGFTDGVVEL